jgi:hypothetical protein
MLRKHIEYLKDNPEGYWFKRKLYGLGWTPAKPAGWITIFSYTVFLIGVVVYTALNHEGSEMPVKTVVLIVLATILLIAITWRTGEPIKWQWGRPRNNHNQNY